jgi:hypothetical protein
LHVDSLCQVKAILFPEYHGAAMGEDFDPGHDPGRESSDSEIEEEKASSRDPEARGSKQRWVQESDW